MAQILTSERGSLATALEGEQQPNRHGTPSKSSYSIFSRSRDNQDANHTDGSVHNDTRTGYLPRVRLGGLTEQDRFKRGKSGEGDLNHVMRDAILRQIRGQAIWAAGVVCRESRQISFSDVNRQHRSSFL